MLICFIIQIFHTRTSEMTQTKLIHENIFCQASALSKLFPAGGAVRLKQKAHNGFWLCERNLKPEPLLMVTLENRIF